MQPSKPEVSKDIWHIFYELCKLVYDFKSKKDIERVFSISEEQLLELINKIVDALPPSIFNQCNEHQLREIEKILAKEFIFFQVQVKVADPDYENALANFIRLFATDIQAKFKMAIK